MRRQSQARVRTVPQYTPDFKKKAVEIITRESDKYTLAAAREELGVSIPTLIKWKKEATQAKEAPSTLENTVSNIDIELSLEDKSLSEQVRLLKYELARVKEERDRLKKGMACLLEC